MVEAPGVAVAAGEAEATRRRLAAEGTLRTDLGVVRDGDRVIFPATTGEALFEFPERKTRARTYQELLPAEIQDLAPRAFEPLGDIVLVKVGPQAWDHRGVIGEALLEFSSARAVFHDHGVTGEFRVRRLDRLAGDGGSQTQIHENGCRLTLDPAAAYFSPRLADERSRIASHVQAGERFVDLFGGVAPQGVQAAKAGASVTSIDLNPDATRLALINADHNKVTVDALTGDARAVAAGLPPADRIVMNLPHGAKHFLDVAAGLASAGAIVHYHEILENNAKAGREQELVQAFQAAGRTATVNGSRHVRNYSATQSHWVFDLEIE